MSKEPDNIDIPWGKKLDYTEDEAREFWNQARARVKRGECDFSEVYFPEDPDRNGFRDIEFQVDANFQGAEFGGVAYFHDAKFGGYASFGSTKFGGYADFSYAKFGGNADFSIAKFGGNAHFWHAEFGGYANFYKAEFGGDADFNYAKFGGDANFWHAEFRGDANFRRAKFGGDANFYRTKFGGYADFITAKFYGDANFWIAKFGGDASFVTAEFGVDASFDNVLFERNVDFRGCRFHQKATMDLAVSRGTFLIDRPRGWRRSTRRPFALMGQGADAYRMAKKSATDRGDHWLAGRYQFAEKFSRNDAKLVSSWHKIINKPRKVLQGLPEFIRASVDFILNRLFFGYGEGASGVVIAAFLVIIGWACLYFFGGIMEDGILIEGSILERIKSCLYFSMVTFTTLGYGDLHPTAAMRFLAAVEALLGAFLMALFVVRKFTR